MTLYDSVISNLKGVVGSRKDGVSLYSIDAEYVSMSGEEFPLQQLGYNTMHDFISNHQDLFTIHGTGRYSRVVNVVGRSDSDSTVNLLSLIQNTQSKNKFYGYQGGFKPHYQSNFQPNYQLNYQPNFQQSYQPNYQSGYRNFQTNPQLNFDQSYKTSNTTSYGFSNNVTFNNNFSNNIRIDRQTTSVAPITMNIYQHPHFKSSSSNGTEERNKTNLLVPIKCLKSAQVLTERSNILVISDDDEPDLILKPCASTQTCNKLFKGSRRMFVNLQTVEIVNMIVDVIIEFRMLRNNEILKIKIEGDLYSHFRLLTGLNIDPILFYDYVVCSIESSRIQHLYKDLIYLDTSKTYCLFNVKSVFNTKMHLPEYDFDMQSEYIVEIFKTFHDNLVAFKISNKLNAHLKWKKSVITEQTKEIIESQHFWSWIPGSLCLVQLPHAIVKRLNTSSVERAIITSSTMASLDDVSIQTSQRYLVHNTSFYLIDHEKEIDKILCCASSYQEVKQMAKENNDTDIAFVCNMSVCAKNTPSKIQFTKLENFNEISSTFLDENKQMKPNIKLVLKNIKKMTVVFHFQPLFSCYSRPYKVVEEPREIKNYKDIEVLNVNEDSTKTSAKYSRKICDYNEIIVISDSDDERPVVKKASRPVLNGHSEPCQSAVSSYSEKLRITKPSDSNSVISEISEIAKYVQKLSLASTNFPTKVTSSVGHFAGSQMYSQQTSPFIPEKVGNIFSSNFASSQTSVAQKFGQHNGNWISVPFTTENTGIKHTPLKLGNIFNTKVTISQSSQSQKFGQITTCTTSGPLAPDKMEIKDSHFTISKDNSSNGAISDTSETLKLSEPTVPADSTQFTSNGPINNTSETRKHPESTASVNSTQHNANKTNFDKHSIVSYSDSDNDVESIDSLILDSDRTLIVRKSDVSLSNSIISYLENNSNSMRKCLRPLTTDMVNVFNGRIVQILHMQTGSAVLMLSDSVKLMKRDVKMLSLKKQDLQKVDKVIVGDFFVWRQQTEISDENEFFLVEVMQLLSEVTVLTNKVHQGLLAVVNIEELYRLPEEKNGDIYGSVQTLIGPTVGAFDLHMFPDWFTPEEKSDVDNQLFTAYFTDNGKLVLEYFEEPCRFLNIEMIASIEKSLTVNHCNIKSGHFIETLSKSLLQCRLFVGNLLEIIVHHGEQFEQLSITKVLCKVLPGDKKDVWFASVLCRSATDQESYEKLSPHNFVDDQFCVDRVMFEERKRKLRLMEYQGVYVDVPENFEGLYKIDKDKIEGSLKGNEEFCTRYMLAGAVGIPDLKSLHNRLIFDIRAF